MLLTPCRNAYEIAKEVHNEINTKKDYVLKLKQYHSPQESLCWIGMKGYEWPAFSHGKYVFFNDVKEGRNLIFCGFHIERGLTKGIDIKPSLLLSDKWTWHRFYKDWQGGKIKEKFQEIEKYAGHLFVRIDVSAGENVDVYDHLLFVQKEGNIQAKIVFNAGLIPQGHKYSSPEDAFSILLNKENESLPFCWIDCYIGFYMGAVKEGIENAFDVWERGLSAFDEYIQ